jgi:acyl-CoA thioesterase
MTDFETAQRCAAEMWKDDRASRSLGIDVAVTALGAATATMHVREDMLNGLDVCHGGMLFTLADTACAFACNSYNRVTLSASGKIHFLRSARLGDRLTAVAVEDYRGGRRGFYTVKITNQQEEAVALFRGRVVSRDEPIVQPKT